MMRAYDIIEICKRLKELYDIPIRINTNGHANLVYGEDITPRLAGLVDIVSISMNARDSQAYQAICQSKFGEDAFKAMLDFAVKCKEHVPKVILTVVNLISREDIQYCQEIAQSIGADFRVRYYAKQSA
jgi:TatD family-associated radical SAM protein